MFVFLSGSRSVNSVGPKVRKILNAYPKNTLFIVGDCYGADIEFRKYLNSIHASVYVFHVGERPRIKGMENEVVERVDDSSNLGQIAKDEYMCDLCHEAIALWDGKSRGTKGNLKRLKDANKNVRIFLS